jgi:hypothetical protein
MSIPWALLWACAIGIWVIAPPLLEEHHLHPDRLGGRVVVEAGLLVLFAIAGVFLGAIGGIAVDIAEGVSKRRFRNRAWAYRLLMGPFVVVGYLADALLIEWNTIGGFNGFWSRYGPGLLVVSAIGAVACALLIAFYRRVVLVRDPKPAVYGSLLCGVTLIGALALLPTMSHQLPSAAVTQPHVAASTRTPPLLFLGLDGATWRVLQPAITSGAAPTFRRLLDGGVHGTIEARWWPYWSSAAWASILTGLPRDVTGVYEDLAATGRGLPWFQVPQFPSLRMSPMFVLRAVMLTTGAIRFDPPPRALLNGKPVWELMHDAGIRSAVVRFRFTYPADGQADTVISDWAGHDEWDSFGVRRDMGVDTVSPRAQAASLLEPFRQDSPRNPALFASLLPGPVPPRPRDALSDPIEALRIASDIDERTFEASESVLRRDPSQPFLAVYIGGLDAVEHSFWPYRFPDDFSTDPPAKADVERLGPVVDRYVRYVDDRLAQILSRYVVTPNVVIVSDHGHGPTTVPSDTRGWHAKEGIFLAAGPSIVHRDSATAVSYYDVVPTLLDLKGLAVPSQLTGHSLAASP